MSSLPEGWVEIELGDVSKVQTGPFGSQLHNEDYVEVGTPMITVEHIVNDKIQHIPSTPKVSDEDKARLSKYILKEGDIVFSRVGSVDRSAYVSAQEDGWMFSGRLLRVRGNAEDVYPHFLHYSLTKESTKQYIRKIAVGATMPSINTGILSEIPIILPPLPEQKAIADMLSSFDEKIELLREQNKTLETLAQTIFKEWFVNFNYPDATGEMVDSELGEIPKDWRVGRLGDVTNIKGGGTPSTKNEAFWNGDIHWTSPKDLSNSKSVFLLDTEKKLTHEGLKKVSSGLLLKGTLLLSSRAPIGYIAISNVDIAINQGYIALLDDAYFSNYYMFFWLKTHMKAVTNAANGSTFLEISKSAFRNIESVIPSESVLKSYNQAVAPLLNKMLQNIKQVQTLSKTRDALLPKLMKGNVRIK